MKGDKLLMLLFLTIVLLFVTGCSKYQLRREMHRFASSPIVIPSDLELISDRCVLKSQLPGDKPLMVIYYDSLECGSCKVNHLIDLTELYELADSTKSFEVVTIFSPKVEEYDELIRLLFLNDFSYPVYVDFSGNFRNNNMHIPSDRKFHNFLLNTDRYPVFVGNPVYGEMMADLFSKALEQIDKN